MCRQMCNECPFNPASQYAEYAPEWSEDCLNDMIKSGHPLDGSLAHGCHMLGDVPETTDENIICIGHRNWLKENFKS